MAHFSFRDKNSVVSLYRQLDWLWTHHGNGPLQVSMGHSQKFDGGGQTHSNVGGTIPWDGGVTSVS